MSKARMTAFLIIVVLLLSSCNSKELTNKESPEIKKITFLTFWDSKEVIDDIVEQFNSLNKDINVNVVYCSLQHYNNVLNQSIIFNEMPDVFSAWAGSSSQHLVDADAVLDMSGREWVDDLLPSVYKDALYDGRLMSLPVNCNFISVAYNKKLFSNYNLHTPKNYEEFLEICKKFKANGILPISTGSLDSSGYIYPLWMLATSNIYGVDKDFNDRVYPDQLFLPENDDRWYSIIKDYKQLIENGYINQDHIAIDRITQALNHFVQGDSAMFFMGSWDLPSINSAIEKNNPGFDLGLFTIPGYREETTALTYGVSEIIMASSSTKYKEEVLRFVDFFASKENNIKLNKALNGFSSRKDGTIDYGPEVLSLLEYTTAGKCQGYPNSSWLPGVGDKFASNILDVLSMEISIETALANIQKFWNDYVEQKSE